MGNTNEPDPSADVATVDTTEAEAREDGKEEEPPGNAVAEGDNNAPIDDAAMQVHIDNSEQQNDEGQQNETQAHTEILTGGTVTEDVGEHAIEDSVHNTGAEDAAEDAGENAGEEDAVENTEEVPIAMKEDEGTENESGVVQKTEVVTDEHYVQMDDVGHAKIDDPIEPPARTAPKPQRNSLPLKLKGDHGSMDRGGFGEVDHDSILNRLFDPDRKQKPALWTHIKLVAPGPADRPPPGHLKWRSRDAIAAYCLKCRMQFTYTRGTSKTVSRHMMAHHGMISTAGEFEDEDRESPKKGWDDVASGAATSAGAPKRAAERSSTAKLEPALKKRKPEPGPKPTAATAPASVLKWFVGSFRPFSMVQDPGLAELFFRFGTKAPSLTGLLRSAASQTKAVKKQIHQRLSAWLDLSLSIEGFENRGKQFFSVRVSFCGGDFERESYTLSVQEADSCKVAVDKALSEYLLPPESVRSITIKNVPADTDLRLPRVKKEKYVVCVLHQMDEMVKTFFNAGERGQVLAKVRRWMEQKHGLLQHGEVSAKLLVNSSSSETHDIYQILQKFQVSMAGVETEADAEATADKEKTTEKEDAELSWFPRAEEKFLIRFCVAALRPFFDAITTLSKEKHPTIGLAIAIVRRIRSVLERLEEEDFGTDGVDEKAVSAGEHSKDLTKYFCTTFATLLNDNPPLMWTIPLDPRLIHLQGLSQPEKESVKQILIENVRVLKKEIDDAASTPERPAGESKAHEQSSTMGGIFWGTGGEDSTVDLAAVYARTSVDRYFSTVQLRRRIDNPLTWWKANQENFPEIRKLARIWLGGPTSFVTSDSRIDERRRTYPEANLEMITFLHENFSLMGQTGAMKKIW